MFIFVTKHLFRCLIGYPILWHCQKSASASQCIWWSVTKIAIIAPRSSYYIWSLWHISWNEIIFQISVLEGMQNINIQWPRLAYIIFTNGSMSHNRNVDNIVNAYVINYETSLEKNNTWQKMLEYIMYFETYGPKKLLENV